ncbi:glycosyltransferase [Acidovorax sp. GBBC 3334]|uniref:glycosyltransferase n=1 Tax=unclassified Acidovorax TaxID=2684926 RepID=UPI0023041644|nr:MULTISPECIES: glycosyltransferase [unclassified Acidovorax]MDA8456182.1 glycosyltransferase [Acidovorax sp. GBBC 3334]MDA8521238.1 glycosyltransferase [Acidovorax sp. NCPPB 4044]
MSAGVSVPSQRHVICMKWGSKYGPEYVNRLYAMVRRHLQGAFRFICLTDDPQGIREEVECFPIPPLDLPPGIPERGWTKLATFSEDLYGLHGPALFLDVDVVVVGGLDEFFTHPGEFVIIHDYKRPWRITGNSSVYRFEIGRHPDVLAYFRDNFEAIRSKFRNEQAYLSDFLHGQGKLSYWPKPWCPSFKYHSIPAWPRNYWRSPSIPQEARIVIFHGECNPPDALAGRRNRRFRHIEPTLWVAEHWRE